FIQFKQVLQQQGGGPCIESNMMQDKNEHMLSPIKAYQRGLEHIIRRKVKGGICKASEKVLKFFLMLLVIPTFNIRPLPVFPGQNMLSPAVPDHGPKYFVPCQQLFQRLVQGDDVQLPCHFHGYGKMVRDCSLQLVNKPQTFLAERQRDAWRPG